MQIGIDASRATRARKTGTEWYSYHLIKNLLECDKESTYVLYTQKNGEFNPPFLIPQNAKQKKLWWPAPYLWTQGRLSLEMLTRSPDTLFVPSHSLPIVTAPRTVTTVHDVGFRQWKSLIPASDYAYLEWSTRFALQHASPIIAISSFTRDELVRLFGADPAAIRVVPLGYDEEMYRPLLDPEYCNLLLDRCKIRKPFILCIGRIDGRKNIGVLLRAFERLKSRHPDLSLVLVGPRGAGSAGLLRSLSASRYADSIHLRGWVREEDKVGLLNACECFVFPSLYEGFGLPILEAQACGAPIACSNTTALPEVAGAGAVYFDPHSISDITEKIEQVISDSSVRERIRHEGFANVKNYSWKKTAEATRDILRQE
ncbi:MAG: glycosyltransferase family 1 protein [Patescibacteria group bacterium]